MIQVKKFNKTTSEAIINKFLSEHLNCLIISYNPYIIQYEVLEKYEQPLVELKGLPIKFAFDVYAPSSLGHGGDHDQILVKFNSGNVIFFTNFIAFMLPDKKFYRLNLNSNTLQYPNGDSVKVKYWTEESNWAKTAIETGVVSYVYLNKMYKPICFRSVYSNSREKPTSLVSFQDSLVKEGLVNTDMNHLYHARTNMLMDIAKIKEKSDNLTAEVLDNGLNNIAHATLTGLTRVAKTTGGRRPSITWAG